MTWQDVVMWAVASIGVLWLLGLLLVVWAMWAFNQAAEREFQRVWGNHPAVRARHRRDEHR